MKKLYFLIAALIVAGSIQAQQIPVDNQYLVNKFSLNPAYAGFTNNYESFLSYRKSWIGIDGAPTCKMININGPLKRNMGIGGSISSEGAGIFSAISATANYSYMLTISKHHSVTFGVYAGIFENHLDLLGYDTQSDIDPVIVDNQQLQGSVFDAGAGLVYRFDKLNVGFVVPRLVESSINNNSTNQSTVYTLKRHLKFHASYNLNITPDIQVEPIVIVGKTLSNPSLFYEATALFTYKQQIWLGATYRKTGMGVSLGATFNRFAMNYTYEFSSKGIMGQSSGSHEVTLGLLIGKNKESDVRPSIFRSEAIQPYQNWKE